VEDLVLQYWNWTWIALLDMQAQEYRDEPVVGDTACDVFVARLFWDSWEHPIANYLVIVLAVEDDVLVVAGEQSAG
jgi:hypothetical protein